MASRRSLGGALGGGALRDGASRSNSVAGGRRRQSFGGGAKPEETTPQKQRLGLLDSSFRDGTLGSSGSRAASAPRRQSFGGDALRGETPIRDRRAMLQAWRVARTGQNGEENETKKRARNDPPLPPSSAFTPNSKDRGYSRKLPRSTHGLSQDNDDYSRSQNSQSMNYYDDDSDNGGRAGGSLLSSRTPLGRRGKLGSARRQTMSGRKILQSTEGKWSNQIRRSRHSLSSHCFELHGYFSLRAASQSTNA
jgi:hypothetical protein